MVVTLLMTMLPPPLEKIEIAHAQPSQEAPVEEKEPEPIKTQVVAEKPKEQAQEQPRDPNGCEPEQYWSAEPPHKCIDKPKIVADSPSTIQKKAASGAVVAAGSGSCAAEIKKYDWNQSVAYNVMMQESGNNAGAVNNNPRTGDYSVGCFQINLYGKLRNSRPPEAQLKNAAFNVQYAYNMYKSQGWSPWGFTTCKIVACY